MTRDTTITIRVSKAVRDAVERLAKMDERTISQYASRVLAKHLKEIGELDDGAA